MKEAERTAAIIVLTLIFLGGFACLIFIIFESLSEAVTDKIGMGLIIIAIIFLPEFIINQIKGTMKDAMKEYEEEKSSN